MRKKAEKQRPLTPCWPEHQLAEEMQAISKILDDTPIIQDLVYQDLSDEKRQDTGAPGMTAEQVTRCAWVKQTHQSNPLKLLIGHPNPNHAEARVRELERKLKRELNYIIMSPEAPGLCGGRPKIQ
jgi:hypothetical protein